MPPQSHMRNVSQMELRSSGSDRQPPLELRLAASVNKGATSCLHAGIDIRKVPKSGKRAADKGIQTQDVDVTADEDDTAGDDAAPAAAVAASAAAVAAPGIVSRGMRGGESACVCSSCSPCSIDLMSASRSDMT